MKKTAALVYLLLAASAFAVPPYPTVWYREKVQQHEQMLSGARDIPGPLLVEGAVTATSFSGDGSSLTGIAAQTAVTPFAKFHDVRATNVFANADVWTPIPFNFTPASENSLGIRLLTNDNYTVEFDFDGHVEINGCTRPKWLGNANDQALLATRIVYSTNSFATTNEARCLQAVVNRARQVAEVGMLTYNGSLTVTDGMQVRLEAQVSSVQLVLSGWPGFANPVAASMNIFAVGAPPIE